MTTVAIIGGTGLANLSGFNKQETRSIETPYGDPSSPLLIGKYQQENIVFLARHGLAHTIPPHKVNYRANIWALKDLGVTHLLAINAVGGIHPQMGPTHIVLPDQLIDYTYNRQHTFFEENLEQVVHIDFTFPYSKSIQDILTKNCQVIQQEDDSFTYSDTGIYGCTQGPRLETKAEVDKLERDGCDIIGMTGMPEAALAAELDIKYGSICLVVNQAAGRSNALITSKEIMQAVDIGMKRVIKLIDKSIKEIANLQ